MKLRDPDHPLKRMAIAIGAAAAIMVAAGLIYLLAVGDTPPAKIDGLKFVAAGRRLHAGFDRTQAAHPEICFASRNSWRTVFLRPPMWLRFKDWTPRWCWCPIPRILGMCSCGSTCQMVRTSCCWVMGARTKNADKVKTSGPAAFLAARPSNKFRLCDVGGGGGLCRSCGELLPPASPRR